MTLSKRSHEGYLMLDHRASPGFTKEQAQKLGYRPEHVQEGKLFEAPTMGCHHCGTVVLINPDRKRDRAYCPHCDRYVCDNCELERKLPNYVHRTQRQKLEQQVMHIELALIKGIY